MAEARSEWDSAHRSKVWILEKEQGQVAEERKRVTARITKVTMARALADAGKYDKALAILRRVRGKYTEERMQRRVDWLIEDIERRKRPTPHS